VGVAGVTPGVRPSRLHSEKKEAERARRRLQSRCRQLNKVKANIRREGEAASTAPRFLRKSVKGKKNGRSPPHSGNIREASDGEKRETRSEHNPEINLTGDSHRYRDILVPGRREASIMGTIGRTWGKLPGLVVVTNSQKETL